MTSKVYFSSIGNFRHPCFFLSLDPRILVESTKPVTVDNVIAYEEAVSGDCMVEVPPVRVKTSHRLLPSVYDFSRKRVDNHQLFVEQA